MRRYAYTAMAIGAGLLLLGAPTELEAQESGVQLWGRTCSRCHNARPVNERTDREWATIVNHMRARANLTRSGAEAILEFLQAANAPEAAAAAAPSAVPAARQAVEPASEATEATEPARTAPEGDALSAEELAALVAYFRRLALLEPTLP